MKKSIIKTISLTIGAFVLGVGITVAAMYAFIAPRVTMEIGMYANERAMSSYVIGYNDGTKGTYNFTQWFSDDVVDMVNSDYEYKFIK